MIDKQNYINSDGTLSSKEDIEVGFSNMDNTHLYATVIHLIRSSIGKNTLLRMTRSGVFIGLDEIRNRLNIEKGDYNGIQNEQD